MTPNEAELLIALLRALEIRLGPGPDDPVLIRALNDLRGFRSALLERWVRGGLEQQHDAA